jgi:tetratricopeptide (TPR) repeat protein
MEVPMSKYKLDINYLSPGFDISQEELEEIIVEADGIITKNKNVENPEKRAEAYLKKSQCLQKLGKHVKSRDFCEGSLSLFPDMVEALVQLGNIYENEKNHDEAINACSRAIQINPNYAAAFTSRGIAYSNKNENEKAIADYTEAIRLKPDYAAAYFNRANAYNTLGEHDKAATDKDEVTRLCSSFAALNNLSVEKRKSSIRSKEEVRDLYLKHINILSESGQKSIKDFLKQGGFL